MRFEVWLTWDDASLVNEHPTEVSMFPVTHDEQSRKNILGPGHHVLSHMIVADSFDDALEFHKEVLFSET